MRLRMGLKFAEVNRERERERRNKKKIATIFLSSVVHSSSHCLYLPACNSQFSSEYHMSGKASPVLYSSLCLHYTTLVLHPLKNPYMQLYLFQAIRIPTLSHTLHTSGGEIHYSMDSVIKTEAYDVINLRKNGVIQSTLLLAV